ncbi:MAG: hypothetical protein Q7T25_02840, partial [Sideroxyarcus sp.]|nr:hypothetical protein [Sideroxyarcus sp.]
KPPSGTITQTRIGHPPENRRLDCSTKSDRNAKRPPVNVRYSLEQEPLPFEIVVFQSLVTEPW